jgi:hypothetical protein
MNMKIIKVLFVVIMVQFMGLTCQSQNVPIQDTVMEPATLIPYDLTPHEWRNLQRMWRRKANPVTIQLVNDSLVYGQILGVHDTALIIWTDEHSFFNPYYADKHLAIIDSDSFRNMFDYYGFTPGWQNRRIVWWTIGGAAFGAAFVVFVGQGWIPFYFALPPAALGTLTGFLSNRKRLEKRDDLSEVRINYAQFSDDEKNKYYTFPGGLPEAISFSSGAAKLDSAAIMQLTFNDVLSKSPHAKHIFRSRPFSISGQFVQTLFTFSNQRKPTYNQPSFGLSARIGLTEWLYTGYSFRSHHYSYYTILQYGETGIFDDYWLNNKSHNLFIQYAPITPDKFLTRRFEISAGIGASINFLDFQSNKWEMYNHISESGDSWYNTNHLHSETIDKTNYGWLLLVDFGYYLSSTLSLNANIEHSFIKELQTRQKTVSNPRTGDLIQIDSQIVNPSSTRYSLGIRLHF